MSNADGIKPEKQSTSPPGITDNPHPEAEKPSANPTIADQFAGRRHPNARKKQIEKMQSIPLDPKRSAGSAPCAITRSSMGSMPLTQS